MDLHFLLLRYGAVPWLASRGWIRSSQEFLLSKDLLADLCRNFGSLHWH
jgi:hypothetical protein